jgi:hypothetical protein
MKWMGCHKTLVINYRSVLCSYPEESRSHLHHGRSLKSCIWSFLVTIMCWNCHPLRCCFLFYCPVLQNLCNCKFFLHIVFNCGLLAVRLSLLSSAQTYINTKKSEQNTVENCHIVATLDQSSQVFLKYRSPFRMSLPEGWHRRGSLPGTKILLMTCECHRYLVFSDGGMWSDIHFGL